MLLAGNFCYCEYSLLCIFVNAFSHHHPLYMMIYYIFITTVNIRNFKLMTTACDRALNLIPFSFKPCFYSVALILLASHTNIDQLLGFLKSCQSLSASVGYPAESFDWTQKLSSLQFSVQ